MPKLTEQNLAKFDKILSIIDESVTKQDFVKSFESITQMVVKALAKLYKDVDSLKETYKTLLANFENRHDTTLKDLRKQVDGLFVGEKVENMSKQHLEKMRKVDEALGRLEDRMSKIRDGKTPKKGVDYFDGRTPKKGVDYFDGLLDNVALEELKKELRDYADNKVKAIPRPMGMKKITYQRSYDMSDQVDGAKRVFTLSRKTLSVNGVRISYFPYNLRPTVDYTVNGYNLTLTSEIQTPPLTHTIIADIEVPFFY